MHHKIFALLYFNGDLLLQLLRLLLFLLLLLQLPPL